jgi:hypothetical protein
MAYKMFDKNFEEISIDGEWRYLYVTDWEDFVEEFGDTWILEGIFEDGVYEYDDYYEKWSELAENSFAYKEILKRVSNSVENTKKRWGIVVTLDTGEKIKTNIVPVSIEDVQEAIGVLVKPSILGMRIKSIEIVTE